jgi:nicotine blue oxidoreductase
VAGTVAGDEGARGWLRAHPDLVTQVECADLGPWTDIDTPADLPD